MQIRIEGLENLVKKTDARYLFRPLRNFLNRSTITIQGRARVNSPVDTGRLRASIGTKLDSASMPTWGEVGTNVEYARPVEYGTGQYSDAPDSKGGRGGMRPRRYLRNAVRDSVADVRGFVNRLGDEIRALWDK